MTDTGQTAFVDATAGVAGDMLLAALLDAGADFEAVAAAVCSLDVPGLDIMVEHGRRGGFGCRLVTVSAPSRIDHERHLADVLELVARSKLSERGMSTATEVFALLAEVEATVHGLPSSQVHFHEVGAHDSLADVVGAVQAFESLGLLDDGADVRFSSLATGSGTVATEHGPLGVPAPAVVGIAARFGLSLTGTELIGERTTPTGAAVLAVVGRQLPMRPMTVRANGVGGGWHDFTDCPNITRVVVGQPTEKTVTCAADDVLVIEATVDDLDPQLWPSVLAALRAAGAWDCWTESVTGRHGRPAQIVSALCPPPLREAVTAAVFRHTTSIGVRWSAWQRSTLPRRNVQVTVAGGHTVCPVTVKVSGPIDGLHTVKAELRDAELAATALGWPVREVIDTAQALARLQVRPSGLGARPCG